MTPFSTRIPVVLALLVLLSPFAAAPAAGQSWRGDRAPGDDSRVSGVVLDHERGQPLGQVAVALRGDAELPTEDTDEDGRFLFPRVPPGVYEITVASLGYVTFRDSLVVRRDSEHELVLELSVSPIPLEPIVTVVARTPMLMEGFEARRQVGRGTYILRQEIEERNARRVSDLLRRVPGTSLVPIRNGGYGVRFRGGCMPSLWVNGTRTVDDVRYEIGIDEVVNPEEVEGIEVYRGAASVPAQFGPESCGAVLVWTRPAARTMGGIDTPFWHRAAIVSGFLLLGVFLVR